MAWRAAGSTAAPAMSAVPPRPHEAASLRVRVALAAVALAVCVSGAALRIALQIRYRRIRRYRMRCSARRLRNLLRPGSHSPQSRPQRQTAALDVAPPSQAAVLVPKLSLLDLMDAQNG